MDEYKPYKQMNTNRPQSVQITVVILDDSMKAGVLQG